MSQQSQVDVIVPCYNYGHLLRQCVTSVLSQHGVAVRVLILDDASSDDTPRVGRALAADDSRVTYRRHEVNARHIATFNEGLAWASASYTLLLSADDMLTPGALRRAAAMFEANPNVLIVYGQAITIRDATDVAPAIPQDRDYPTRVIDGQEFIRDACVSGDNIVFSPTVIVRTAFQHELGGYRPQLLHTGDFEMWMRFASRGDVGYVDGPQAMYRVHGSNMSSSYSLARDLEQRKLAFDALFESQRSHIVRADELYRTALRSLATSAFWAGSHAFDDGENDVYPQFLDVAHRIDSSFRRSAPWLKFTMKRALGARMWKHLRPIVAHMKG